MEKTNIPFKILSKKEVYALTREEKALYFKKLGAQISSFKYVLAQENDSKRSSFKSILVTAIFCLLVGCITTFAIIAFMPITDLMLNILGDLLSEPTHFKISAFVASTQLSLYKNLFASITCLTVGIALITFTFVLIKRHKISQLKQAKCASKILAYDDDFYKELLEKTSVFLDEEFLNSDAIQTMATYFSEGVTHNIEVAKHLYGKEKEGFSIDSHKEK